MAIRQRLLQSLRNESVAHVRNKIGDAVAEIAGQYADNGTFDRVDFGVEIRPSHELTV